MSAAFTRTVTGALVLPVLAGIAAMTWLGAPQAYLATNAAALLAALGCAAWLPVPQRGGGALLVASSLIALFVATAWFGTEQDGVRRWLRIGPFTLHAGYLLLPLAALLLWRVETSIAAAFICLLAIAAALQPDLAVSAGIAALALAHALQRRRPASWAACLFAFAACLLTLRRDDPLATARFVEFLPQQAWAAAPLASAGLIAVQVIAIIVLAGRGARAGGAAALVLGCTAVSWFAPYPSLLIGYGAAPIVGLGLALAALR